MQLSFRRFPLLFYATSFLPSSLFCKQSQVKRFLIVNIRGQGESYPPKAEWMQGLAGSRMWWLALHLLIIIKSSLSSIIHQHVIDAIYSTYKTTFKFSCMLQIKIV
jgi:hypothetical protein